MTDYLHNNYEHTCDSLIIACIDFRFIDDLSTWEKELQLDGHCDLLNIGGASKNIAQPAKPEYQELLMSNIDISVNLHKIKQIFLVHHEDCGAYGGKKAFLDDSNEYNTHLKDMNISTKIINSKYPDVKVVKVYVKQDGELIVIND